MARQPRTTRLVSGGDVMFNGALAAKSAAAPQARQALAYLDEADICFMNCEMPLTCRGQRVEKTVNLRSDPLVARELAALGIDVVTLANNHMLDFGDVGLVDTLAAIDQARIARVGAGLNVDEALQAHHATVNDHRFAFIGVAATLPPGFAAGNGRPGIAPIHVSFSFEVDPNLMAEQPGTAPRVRTAAVPADVDRLTSLIAAAKSSADHVIVAIHWGLTRRRVTPYQGMIADYQPPLAHALIDAGADMLLGNHSHNLHGVEVYQGKPIFYSLGNFIFAPAKDYMEPESVIVAADFDDSGLRVELVPIWITAEGFPEIPRGAKRDHVIALLKERSARFGTQFTPTPSGVGLVLH